ncbi:hypothetical protein [Mesorhizobium sp. WSM2239]|uniref:Uncharacterized protein n=2 Tax=unclassified Mesorhizobium TaxID=325217 RepID=A0AAU8D9I8_9HYPH
MRKLPATALLAIVALSAGCATEETARMDGLTVGAGNAMAANTVMQMVDPWPRGVEDTNLIVPADMGQYRTDEAAAVAAERVDSSIGDK